jgi:hypothetical protein
VQVWEHVVSQREQFAAPQRRDVAPQKRQEPDEALAVRVLGGRRTGSLFQWCVFSRAGSVTQIGLFSVASLWYRRR